MSNEIALLRREVEELRKIVGGDPRSYTREFIRISIAPGSPTTKVNEYPVTFPTEAKDLIGVVTYQVQGSDSFLLGVFDHQKVEVQGLTPIDDWISDITTPINDRYKRMYVPNVGAKKFTVKLQAGLATTVGTNEIYVIFLFNKHQ